MNYPKLDGKPIDNRRRKEFDEWRERFEWAIRMSEKNVSDEDIKVLSWNCAFEVIAK